MKSWMTVIPLPLGLLLALAMLLASSLSADVLKTRDGRLLSGTFRGATEQEIHFEVDGVIQTLPMTQVATLNFSEGAQSAIPAKPPTPAPTAAAAPAAPKAAQATQLRTVAAAKPASVRMLGIPAGTKIRVRLSDSLDPRHAAEGDRFSALLETPLVADGITIAGVNTKVYGKVGETLTTGPVDTRIKLELTELVLQGQAAGIVTGTQKIVEASGAAPAKGAPNGDAEALHAEKIPSGTHLEFRLLRPLEIQLR
jgi:hypothetical protein